MYSIIHQALCQLGDFLIRIPHSTILRSLILWIPIIVVYVPPLFLAISAKNSYKIRKQYVSTGWTKLILILFCIDGFFYNIFVYKFPNTAYPLPIIILEVIICLVLLIILLANCNDQYGKAIRLFVDTYFIGYGYFLLANFCWAMWGWGVEILWLRILAVIIFIIGTIKVIRM